MKPISFQSVLRCGGLFLALAFTVLLAGCSSIAYNDPNVPANARYFNTVTPQPGSAGAAQPITLVGAQPRNPAGVQPSYPVGAQYASSAAAVPPVNAAAPVGTNDAPTNSLLLLPGMQASSKLGVGDLLTVNFSDIPKGSMPDEQQHRIGDDGILTLPWNVQIQAVGKTPTQLQSEIRKAYVPKYFVNLTVVVKAQDRYVYVDGEVKVPNRQFHIDGLTVLRAISTAGGFTDFANKRKIEVRRHLTGRTEFVDWKKARSNPKLDLPLYVNDQVYVHRGIW